VNLGRPGRISQFLVWVVSKVLRFSSTSAFIHAAGVLIESKRRKKNRSIYIRACIIRATWVLNRGMNVVLVPSATKSIWVPNLSRMA
jgi:hypothetical protein